MAVQSGQPSGTAARSGYGNAERVGFGVLMIGAPILMLGAALTHPPHGIESGAQYYHASHDYSTRFYVAHTCFFLSATLFVPAFVGLARLVHPSHPKAAFWGCVLSLMGFVGWGALDGIDYMAWMAGKPDTGLDETVMQQFVEEALHTNAILIPVLVVFTLLPIGTIVLAVGLTRADVVPSWLAALMPLGLVGVAASLQYPVLLILSALALLASFGIVGVNLLRTTTMAVSSAPPV
jgi:hypothetical protein